jgi:hypothetical protein
MTNYGMQLPFYSTYEGPYYYLGWLVSSLGRNESVALAVLKRKARHGHLSRNDGRHCGYPFL